ncbi:MAG TPA: hypothetical protein VKI44_27820 [Acetobacteraceae bacterium]|nr:hypothetical protein [Acetobacteraceae bacterium]
MTDKFARERHLVMHLMQRLGIAPSEYVDPNAAAGHETGIDVVAIVKARRIGVQVTELDTGAVPGRSRGAEKRDARAARETGGGVYFGWAPNDPAKMIDAVRASIARKCAIADRHTFDGISEVWLLVSAGVPEIGAVISTSIVTPWLSDADLNNATLPLLEESKYRRAFVHSIVAVPRVLYSWSPGRAWQKTIQPEPAGTQGPSFWDLQSAARRHLRERGLL